MNHASMNKDLAHIKPCGCWVVYIAQGVMVLPCYGHETSVLTAIEKPFGEVNDPHGLADASS